MSFLVRAAEAQGPHAIFESTRPRATHASVFKWSIFFWRQSPKDFKSPVIGTFAGLE
jgi:hypothetical protein